MSPDKNTHLRLPLFREIIVFHFFRYMIFKLDAKAGNRKRPDKSES